MHDYRDMLPLLPALYAEMHFTLRGFSLIHRRWPEIVADAPFRVEPDTNIPILLLAKDAQRFPTVLDHVHAVVRYPDGSEELHALVRKPVLLKEPWWASTHAVKPRKGFSGDLAVDIAFHVHREDNVRMRVFHNDNYGGTSHRPLRVHVAGQPFPRFDGWFLGDLHYHSRLTSGQTEFGAPLKDTAVVARAQGLDFSAVTDHSYDLDDLQDDFLKADPELSKWRYLQDTVQSIQEEEDFLFLPGEEVTCRNRFGRNVHLLLINNRRFVPGSGDGAERWFHTRSEHCIAEILDGLEEGALAFAAHPEVPFNPLHWLFLKRWKWTRKDYLHTDLDGLEILNGGGDFFFRRGLRQWVRLLLEGRKLSIISGNDAHGNFNRFRQLGLPFLTFRENNSHVFGRDRTAVFIDGESSKESILEALRRGRSTITTGPALNLTLENEEGRKAGIGDTISGRRLRVRLEALSTREFGRLRSIKVWQGVPGQEKETLVRQDTFDNPFRIDDEFTLENSAENAYLRAEVTTRKKGRTHFCLTNPIWINDSL